MGHWSGDVPASIDTCGAAIRVLTAWLVFEHQLQLRQYRISLTLHPCMPGRLYAFSLVLLVVLGHNPFNLLNIIAQQKYLYSASFVCPVRCLQMLILS